MTRHGTPTRERVFEESLAKDSLLESGERFEEFREERGWLLVRRRTVAVILSAVAIASFLSFFVKPRAPHLELVTPAQEIENYEATLPQNHQLAERVVGSFGMAMVLVRNPYTEQNASALENVRAWAKQRFQDAPDFLHPVSVRAQKEPNDTIFGALGYNLFAAIHYACQAQVGNFISSRISSFHDTDAYKSFQNAFFTLFGKDNESATLLARYQTEKAKASIEAVLWGLCWLVYAGVSAMGIVLAPRKRKFEALRLSCSAAWMMVGISNASHAWMENSIPSMLSGAVAIAASLFLWKPFLLRTRTDATLKVAFYEPGSNWVAVAVWATYSLMAILVLTWIRAGVPDYPDPISLILSAVTGNFVQDPEEGKRAIARLVGFAWIAISVWALTQRDGDKRVEDQLESLKTARIQ